MNNQNPLRTFRRGFFYFTNSIVNGTTKSWPLLTVTMPMIVYTNAAILKINSGIYPINTIVNSSDATI